MRVDLAETGWYMLEVGEGSSPKPGPTERGPYRFTVELLGTSPEGVPSALVPGDSVTGEAIDAPGDWDEYALRAAAGQDLNIVFQTPGSPGYPWLIALDPTTGDTLAWVVGQSFERAVGPFRAPASGEVRIVVAERRGEYFGSCYDATCGNVFRFVGPYRFRVVAVNRAPENVPSSFALGDTVRGEAIFPAGDIDEFTSTGTPGEAVSPWWRLTANPVPISTRRRHVRRRSGHGTLRVLRQTRALRRRTATVQHRDSRQTPSPSRLRHHVFRVVLQLVPIERAARSGQRFVPLGAPFLPRMMSAVPDRHPRAFVRTGSGPG